MFTEFGADAFDARRGREDDVTQARYLVAQWREIYEQSAGKGKVGNAIGGFVFQWSDGWWKYLAGVRGAVVGIDRFGESAPAGDLLRQFGFTVDAVLQRARALLSAT